MCKNMLVKPSGTSYVAKLIEIIITSMNDVKFKLTWSKFEAGKTRDPFILNFEDVSWLKSYRRSLGDKSTSLRARKQTNRFADQSSDRYLYKVKLNDLNKMIIQNGEKSQTLKHLCKDFFLIMKII